MTIQSDRASSNTAEQSSCLASLKALLGDRTEAVSVGLSRPEAAVLIEHHARAAVDTEVFLAWGRCVGRPETGRIGHALRRVGEIAGASGIDPLLVAELHRSAGRAATYPAPGRSWQDLPSPESGPGHAGGGEPTLSAGEASGPQETSGFDGLRHEPYLRYLEWMGASPEGIAEVEITPSEAVVLIEHYLDQCSRLESHVASGGQRSALVTQTKGAAVVRINQLVAAFGAEQPLADEVVGRSGPRSPGFSAAHLLGAGREGASCSGGVG